MDINARIKELQDKLSKIKIEMDRARNEINKLENLGKKLEIEGNKVLGAIEALEEVRDHIGTMKEK